ncbi:hypothetical protein SHKM778_59890 [Streptomyces sp. KM77-8]|uniref:HTH asnC-type domain-containing protein n=1 Tax=Streptomyces haneummycinicus TaxID=3074435 RepID=A0AAT9HPS2_9ACTN
MQSQSGEIVAARVHGLGGECPGGASCVHAQVHGRKGEQRTGSGGRIPCYVRPMAESVVLDPVDLHLLRLLQNDARTTYRDLAAQVGVAPSTCLDRVTRLRRSG